MSPDFEESVFFFLLNMKFGCKVGVGHLYILFSLSDFTYWYIIWVPLIPESAYTG